MAESLENKSKWDKIIPIGCLILLVIFFVSVAFFPKSVFGDKVIKTPTTNPIYNVGNTVEGDISVFDDGDVKCYVVMASSDNDEADISCVRMK